MTRAELTEKIAVLKRKKKLSWRDIAAKIGPGSPIYYTAALHGQMKLSKTEAEAQASCSASMTTMSRCCRKCRIAARCRRRCRPIR